MKRKRITSLAGLLGVPVTPVENTTGWQSKAEFFAAEKDLAEKPTRDAIENQRQVFLKLRKLASEFWRRPIEELRLSIYQDSAKDVTFDAPPVVRESYSREDLIQACDKWHEDYFTKSRYGLNPDGVMRLCCYGESQARSGADFSQPATWQAAFDQLAFNLKAFGAELDSSRVPRQPKPPAPQPTLSDIEKFNKPLDSTDGRREMLALVTDLYESDAAVVLSEWLDHLRTRWDVTLTTGQNNAVLAWFRRNSASWLDARNFDRCRRALSRSSEAGFPDLRTNDEVLCDEIENESTPLMKLGFEDKRDLERRLMRLADPA